MPPSSRKRNKGKERKAKQLAKKEEFERTDAHRIWRSRLCNTSIGCNHGCDVAISDDHPVSSFMDQFIINAHYKDMVVSEILTVLFDTHPQVWNNESYRKLVIDILIRIGTNILLNEAELTWPIRFAQAIMPLEHFNERNDIIEVANKRVVTSKWIDLEPDSSSIRRDCLKFYRKRISCKCLKKMHLEARKSETKMGICWHCKAERERTTLNLYVASV